MTTQATDTTRFVFSSKPNPFRIGERDYGTIRFLTNDNPRDPIDWYEGNMATIITESGRFTGRLGNFRKDESTITISEGSRGDYPIALDEIVDIERAPATPTA